MDYWFCGNVMSYSPGVQQHNHIGKRTVLMPPWKYMRMYLKMSVRMCLTKSALIKGKIARMLLQYIISSYAL